MRSSRNRQTGYTPNLLMLGREVWKPVELVFGTSSKLSVQSESRYVRDLKNTLENAHSLARKHLRSSQAIQKRHYDLHASHSSFKVGDVVYRKYRSTKSMNSRKLCPVWSGPFLIVGVVSPVLYCVRSRRRSTLEHVDCLKPCFEKNIPSWVLRARDKLDSDSCWEWEEPLALDNLFGTTDLDETCIHASGNDNPSCPPLPGDLDVPIPIEKTTAGTLTQSPVRSKRGRHIKVPEYLAMYDLN